MCVCVENVSATDQTFGPRTFLTLSLPSLFPALASPLYSSSFSFLLLSCCPPPHHTFSSLFPSPLHPLLLLPPSLYLLLALHLTTLILPSHTVLPLILFHRPPFSPISTLLSSYSFHPLSSHLMALSIHKAPLLPSHTVLFLILFLFP